MEGRQHRSYSPAARRLHWATAALLAIMFPLGLAMSIRGGWLGIWDTLTNTMYSTHKLLGCVVFFVVVARLAHRLRRGAPRPEPTIATWQAHASLVTHRAMYALALTVPVIGWFGVQLYPALDVFGLFPLPAVVAPDKAASGWVMTLHAVAAFALLFLVAVHAGAALFHHFVRRDGVLRRMLPGLAAPPGE